MKLSLLLLIGILLNTSLLLAVPLVIFIGNIERWPFLILEFFLLVCWYIHKIILEIKKECIIDLGKLNVFVYKDEERKN